DAAVVIGDRHRHRVTAARGKHVVDRERLVRVQGQGLVPGAVAEVDRAGPGVAGVRVGEGAGEVHRLPGQADQAERTAVDGHDRRCVDVDRQRAEAVNPDGG